MVNLSLVYLDELCDSISETYDKNTENIVLINTSDVFNGKVLNHEFVPNKDIKGQFKKLFQKGDILYSEIRPANKHYAFVDFESKDYVASTKLMVLRPKKEKIRSKYLYYILKNKDIVNFLQGLAESRSGTFPQITFSELSTIDIDLPSLENQDIIVEIIDTIESKIENLEKINKNLQELAKSIYRYHFIDFEPYSQGNFISTTLGEIPENWSVQLIEEFVDDMKNGGTPKRGEPDYWDNGTIPWLKTGEINNNIIIKSEEHITELGLKNSSAKLLPINSIIMALYGKGTAARIGLLKHEATTNQACCAMICNDFNKTLFLYLFLLFNQKEIENLASGSVQQNLSKDIIANLELVVPPIEIIEKLPFKEIYDKISNNYFEIEYLTNLRDTLLPKLMSGEIDVSKINCDLE